MPDGDHPSEVSGVFRAPFPEQVAFFRGKLGNLVPTERWDDMLREAHDTGFMVAGAAKADLLADLGAAVDRAITEGKSLEAFRKDFRSIVGRHGWTGWTGEGSLRGEAWRVRTIYSTNMYTSYSAGRLAQLRQGNFQFWVYRHGGSREPRPAHLSWDGVALPPDHEFWKTHYPPSDWGCSCYVVGARSARGVKRLGGDPGKTLPDNWKKRDPKTGAPIGIGKGWDYAPGDTVSALVTQLARKLEQWPAPIGAQAGEAMAGPIAKGWREWLDATQSGESHEPGLVGTLHVDDVKALASRDATPESAEIYFRPGLVRGPKADRYAKKGRTLDPAILKVLPDLIRSPRAVLFDEGTGKLLYVVEIEGSAGQFAIEINFRRKGRGERDPVNMIVSAYDVRLSDLRGRVRGGKATILRGALD